MKSIGIRNDGGKPVNSVNIWQQADGTTLGTLERSEFTGKRHTTHVPNQLTALTRELPNE